MEHFLAGKFPGRIMATQNSFRGVLNPSAKGV